MTMKRLQDGELERFAKENNPKLLVMIQRAFDVLFPAGKYNAKLEEGVINISESSYGPIITIEPSPFVAKRIGGSIEIPGFLISTWKTLPATRYEPEDVSQVELAQTRCLGDTLEKSMECLFRIGQLIPYMDRLADEAMAESLANDPS